MGAYRMYTHSVLYQTLGPGLVVLPTKQSLKVVLAYICVFCAPVIMNSCMYRVVKVYSVILKDTALILSKSHFDQCMHTLHLNR